MKLHRFYVSPEINELTHSIWIHDERLLNQWHKVLRFRQGDQVVLFDGIASDRLYIIVRMEPKGVQLELITEFERKLPNRHIYLFFSLLKKDKNDWVLQKCTELGVSNFVPLIAKRSEKTGFNIERAEKIVIEAAEQCGRSDIPHIREPTSLDTALNEYKDKVQLLVADESPQSLIISQQSDNPIGIFIGPEGGWTEIELELFKDAEVKHLQLGNLTLRAETAAVAAVTKVAT
jgi:16S rRNA (uracil1498-N3)-methyltransferase